MAALPPCTVGCRIKKAVKFAENKLYSLDIFVILLIELFSFTVMDEEDYAIVKFPLLMYATVYILLRTIITKSDYLKHCYRKKLTYKVISYYYLFGFFAAAFQLGSNIYSTVISNGLLLIAFVLMVMSYKEKYKD